MAKIFMASLGCAKNLVDAEVALGKVLGKRHSLAVRPEDADVILINTCGFIRPARDESHAVIDEMLEFKAASGGRVRVAAMGCLAQKEAERLAAAHPGLDAVWGLDISRTLAESLAALTAGKNGRCVSGIADGTVLNEGPRLVTTLPAFAYLRLSDGCDNRCAYCSIPSIRGGLRSRNPEEVIAEAKLLEKDGARELVLIAQDTTAYGHDPAGGGTDLASLLTRLLKAVSVPRIRVLYAHPAHLDDRVIDLLLNEPRLCRYLDLPVQHVSDRILAAMGRGYGRRRVMELAERFAGAGGFTLRTTLLLGFPGETESDFEEAVALARSGAFQQLGAFAYSPEEDVPASRLPDQVPPAEAERRRDAVLSAQSGPAFAWLDSRIGGTERVLVTRLLGDGWAEGRTEREAPDADGLVFVHGRDMRAGDLISACITAREDYDLVAEVARGGAGKGGGRRRAGTGGRG